MHRRYLFPLATFSLLLGAVATTPGSLVAAEEAPDQCNDKVCAELYPNVLCTATVNGPDTYCFFIAGEICSWTVICSNPSE
jgi:hypothetical protein